MFICTHWGVGPGTLVGPGRTGVLSKCGQQQQQEGREHASLGWAQIYYVREWMEGPILLVCLPRAQLEMAENEANGGRRERSRSRDRPAPIAGPPAIAIQRAMLQVRGGPPPTVLTCRDINCRNTTFFVLRHAGRDEFMCQRCFTTRWG